MTIIVSIAEQAYTPRTISQGVTVGAGLRRLHLSCTRVAWPAGAVGRIEVTFPDGSIGPQCGFSGGTAFKKDGVTVAIESGMEVVGINGADLPAGVYGALIVIQQTVTTAIKIEGF